MKMQVCGECGGTTFVLVTGPWVTFETVGMAATANALCAKCGENGADMLWVSETFKVLPA